MSILHIQGILLLTTKIHTLRILLTNDSPIVFEKQFINMSHAPLWISNKLKYHPQIGPNMIKAFNLSDS